MRRAKIPRKTQAHFGGTYKTAGIFIACIGSKFGILLGFFGIINSEGSDFMSVPAVAAADCPLGPSAQ